MTQKFKVGEKVKYLRNGAVFNEGEILTVEVDDGGPFLPLFVSKGDRKFWVSYADVKSSAQNRNERISVLESQVAELTAKVEALENAGKPSIKFVDTAEAFIDGKLFGKLNAVEARVLSENEQRKAIIAEAKTFVADLTAYINPESGGYKQEHPKYGTISHKVYTYLSSVFFTVKSDTREVTVVIKRKNPGEITAKATAKCTADDVFNADIGKAIALGRALGLDVKRFEHAVKPTEVVVGHVIGTYFDSDTYAIKRVDDVKVYTRSDDPLHFPRKKIDGNIAFITDDTDAQY